MVAIIKNAGSVKDILKYNENKLKQNKAKLVHSMNFGKDTEQLGLSDKLKTIEKRTSLNERTKLNAVHISLNFHPSEKLAANVLQQIADVYMQKIGFEFQPYLVYEHSDTGHPHIHIVSTNIRSDGSAILMHKIGRNFSAPARKEIEQEFNLITAQRQQIKELPGLKPFNAQRVHYGKTETKKAIADVLNTVLPLYKYTSLPELNALLKLYNVTAERGGENSRTYHYNGLVYRLLDENGKKIGCPIKASSIYKKPGMKFLTQQFEFNKSLKQSQQQRIKNAVDLFFIRHKDQSLEQMIAALQPEKINVLLPSGVSGKTDGVIYIDHQTRCVFNGLELGQTYSMQGLQERCKIIIIQQHAGVPSLTKPTDLKLKNHKEQQIVTNSPEPSSNAGLTVANSANIMQILLQKEYEDYFPGSLSSPTQKKKRKKRIHK